jgi:hypothetical protein
LGFAAVEEGDLSKDTDVRLAQALRFACRAAAVEFMAGTGAFLQPQRPINRSRNKRRNSFRSVGVGFLSRAAVAAWSSRPSTACPIAPVAVIDVSVNGGTAAVMNWFTMSESLVSSGTTLRAGDGAALLGAALAGAAFVAALAFFAAAACFFTGAALAAAAGFGAAAAFAAAAGLARFEAFSASLGAEGADG